jgi:hypothetical protein
MRADGSEFPVEIAITRPQVAGPPLFTGYLRDAAERKRHEQALRSLAEEQAALRRVATAVASEAEQERVFAVVTEEVGRLLGGQTSNMVRYEPYETAVVSRQVERDAVEDDGGSLAVSAAQRPGKDGGGERKERHDHQQQGVQEQHDPVGCTDVVEHDVVVSPHLSDEQECEGVGEIRRPERDEAVQQASVVSRCGLISRTSRVMVMAKTASLNATNHMVSR